MVKVLAWVTLGVSLLFVILALTAVFAWGSLCGDHARMLGQWGAVPRGILVLLLTVCILVAALVTSEPSES